MVSLLSACGSSTKSVEANPELTLRPLPDFLRTCESPEVIDAAKAVNGFYTPEELYKGWARDRKRLVECRNKHNAVVGYYDELVLNLEMMEVGFKPVRPRSLYE